MRILVLTTGGTIDKRYSLAGEFEIGKPAAPHILDQVLTGIEFVFQSVCAKDSLDLDDADRAAVRARVEAAVEHRIVITHGTDTMTRTAEALSGIERKVVVLTGAMQPARMTDSDAAFNLGVAVHAVQTLEPGIYVAMSGRVFAAAAVAKDPTTGIFSARP